MHIRWEIVVHIVNNDRIILFAIVATYEFLVLRGSNNEIY